MAGPKPGEKFTVNEDIGNPGHGVPAGTVVTVREVVAADVTGAHTNDEDAVVVEFDTATVGVGDDGKPALVYTPRAFSVGVGSFGDQFTKEG